MEEAEVSSEGGVNDLAWGVSMPGEGADEESNSIFRFGREPYILLAAWESILGTGLVGESKFCGKYGTAGGMKLRLENPNGVGVLALWSLAPCGVRSS